MRGQAAQADIYSDKRAGGYLWRQLPCQKLRKRRCGSGRARRHLIPNRVPIEMRPAIVERKTRLGDTLDDNSHRNAIVTLVDRVSMRIVLAAAPKRNAQLDVIANRLNNRPRKKLGYLTPLKFIDLRYSTRRKRALHF